MSRTTGQRDSVLSVGIGGLGTIGRAVAEALDAGIPGLRLAAVSDRDFDKARQKTRHLRAQPEIQLLRELAESCDVVIECAPAEVFDEVAAPAISAGRILVALSSGALLARPALIDEARSSGARIIVPSGGILGLDALRAAAEGAISSVTLITRKPPASLAGAPYLARNNINIEGIREPLQIFDGNAIDAVAGFPANANVAATLSLAGVGPMRTRVQIWADPGVERNYQEVHVTSDSAEFRLSLCSFPMPENPRTGSLTPRSVIAALRAMTSELTFGH